MRLFYLFFCIMMCSSIISCTKNVYEYYGVGSETEHETDNGKTDEKKNKEETTEEIRTVADFLKNDFGETSVWVEGYIVGSCTKSIKNAVWEYPFPTDNAICSPTNQVKPIQKRLLLLS